MEKVREKMVWVEIFVRHVISGITGAHYVKVSGNLVNPVLNAIEREKSRLSADFEVIGGRRWG